ncbi:hypothetical protein OBV_01420 [Oscillibacter valericigenes Sjm18-20]|nr:hypothetical protein OBV_01420 [Oscillibacter valericigenes Sjm18-20]
MFKAIYCQRTQIIGPVGGGKERFTMRNNLSVAASFYYFTEVRFAGRNYRAQKLEKRLKD